MTMGGLDGDEKARKKRRYTSPNGQIPRGVACQPSAGMVGTGVLLSVSVVVLYLFGFYEVALSLPDIPFLSTLD